MTEKELNAALEISKELIRKKAMLDDLRTGGLRSLGSNTPVQGGVSPGTTGELASELDEDVRALSRALADEQAIIKRYLEKLSIKESDRKLLTYRYVDCKPWKQVAVLLGYSERRVYQLHDDAIKISVGCSSLHLNT